MKRIKYNFKNFFTLFIIVLCVFMFISFFECRDGSFFNLILTISFCVILFVIIFLLSYFYLDYNESEFTYHSIFRIEKIKYIDIEKIENYISPRGKYSQDYYLFYLKKDKEKENDEDEYTFSNYSYSYELLTQKENSSESDTSEDERDDYVVKINSFEETNELYDFFRTIRDFNPDVIFQKRINFVGRSEEIIPIDIDKVIFKEDDE